jgi:ribosomal protein S12 methylthiotransferase
MRFWIDRHGCAKNDVDGEEIIARLEAAGNSYVDGAEDADLVIVNTCGFIEDAKRESIEAVVSLKAAYPGKRVLVAGCLAQRYAADLGRDLPEADGIVGNADLSAIVAAAQATLSGERPVLVPEAAPSIGTVRRARRFDFPGTAHVKATEGCSNHCSFCAIPLIRGELHSRSLEEVAAECADLVGQGARELVLIGQDLGSFGRDAGSERGAASGAPLAEESLLPALLERLTRIEGDFRVRTLYIHPDRFPERMLEVMKGDPRLVPYFDLPFQHASERVLAAMNRKGSGAKYLELIDRIRSSLPDAAIRSTFLLGFPGETDGDFEELRDFQEKAKLDWVGSFAYSREEGTAAYAMRGRVPKKVVEARRAAVEEAQERITRERLARFVGREMDVLVEERVERTQADEESLSLGRAWNQAPDVDGLTVLRGELTPGEMVKARILAVNGVDFDATPAGSQEKANAESAESGHGDRRGTR